MRLRIGLVGRGPWSRRIAATLDGPCDVNVVPISWRDPVDTSLDGVVIANRSEDHGPAALPYLKAGVATFIEKPMTTSVTDAERLRDAASASGAPVQVGHVYLHNSAFRQLLSVLPEVRPIDYILCDSANRSPRSDSSILWDWLPHDLSMLNAVLGVFPDRVAAWALCGGPSPQAAVVRYSFGGLNTVSTVSWRSAHSRKSMTVVAGTATLVFDDKAKAKLVRHDVDGARSEVSHHDTERPLTSELAAFLEVARSRENSPASIDLAVSIAHCIESAERSMALGGTEVAISLASVD